MFPVRAGRAILPPVKICHLYISPGHNFWVRPKGSPGENPIVELTQVDCVAGRGLLGDRYFDHEKDYEGQATFISADVFDEVCSTLGVSGRPPGITRRNVVVRGADLNSLVGKTFVVQGVEFEGVCECSPCSWMDHVIAPGAKAAMEGRGGLRVRILSDGRLRVDA